MGSGAARLLRARRFARAAAASAIGVGLLVLLGWEFDVHWLKSVYGNITMKPNAALGLMLGGFSLWRLDRERSRTWGSAAAIAAGLIGSLTLLEHLSGLDFGIDQLLFEEAPGALATMRPGRMGPPASICFTLLGTSLLLMRRGRAAGAQVLAALVSAVALLSIVGYAYRAEQLYGLARYSGISLHTALALFGLGLGLLAVRAGEGPVAALTSDHSGGMLARRLLPAAVLLPFTLGWLSVKGQTSRLHDLGFGSAFLVASIILAFTFLLWRTAASMNEGDRQRHAALDRIGDMVGKLRDGFFAFDPDWRHSYVNDRGVEMAGKPREALLGRRLWEAFPELLGTGTLNRLRAAQAAQKAATFEEFHPPSGAWMEFSVHPTPEAIAVLVRDVTARRILDREREALLEREQTASRLKDEFLANVSHELRTPLNAILGWTHILTEQRPDPARLERGLAVIARNALSQARIIEDLLDVSRLAAGQMRLEMRDLDLVALIRSCLESIRVAAEARKVAIEFRHEEPAEACSGDAARLQQVLWNLLSNAVKFTPEGGRIAVSLTGRGSSVEIAVTDTGEGIEADLLPIIFDRFRQGDGSMSRRHGGLGLGLALARELVEMHGGSIEAASAGSGHGSTFTVRLPRSRESQVPVAAAAAERPDLGGLRILAADDDPDARETLAGVLTGLGAQVRTVASSREALAVLSWDPHVVLCDLGMPGEDGYALLARLRAGAGPGGAPGPPAIALTGYAGEEERRRAIEAGFRSFLTKPVPPDLLAAEIRAAVATPRSPDSRKGYPG